MATIIKIFLLLNELFLVNTKKLGKASTYLILQLDLRKLLTLKF